MPTNENNVKAMGPADVNNEAAVAMALHLYFDEAHDIESNKITICEPDRRYSPWASKIFGLNNLIRR